MPYTMLDTINFINSYIHVVGWGFLGIIAWKIRGGLDKFMAASKATSEALLEAKEDIEYVKQKIDKLTDNHFQHLQETVNRSNELLEDINKGIYVLVDRSK
jgi:hypothetical protein